MDDSDLARLAIFCSLAGLLALYLVAEWVRPPVTGISELQEQGEGAPVRVRGFITSIETLESRYVMEVSELKEVRVTAFTDKRHDPSWSPGMWVEVEGRVREYKGRKELVADRILLSDHDVCSGE